MKLVGLMAYEGQIAGVGDDVPGKSDQATSRSARCRLPPSRTSATRRAEIVAAVSEVTELEFVNGGGTGSIELTTTEGAVTEIAAGSGFYAPILFDHYRSFSLNPAAMFALPVVRKPRPRIATALGGGYLASGAGGKDRMPVPHLPAGLRLDPLRGDRRGPDPAARRAPADGPGDRRPRLLPPRQGRRAVRALQPPLPGRPAARSATRSPTYRGEGMAFL